MRYGKVLLTSSWLILVALSAVCHAELYVEGYAGGSFALDQEMSFSNPRACCPGTRIFNSMPGKFDNPFVIGGMKAGVWFVKDGSLEEKLLGGDYPGWMKYVGFYIDLGYQNLDFERQAGLSVENPRSKATNVFSSNGDVFSVACMFAGRYGLLPDSEVPFGRLQPYFAVGPAILITGQEPAMTIDPKGRQGGPFVADLGRKTDTVVGFQVEPGVRWMLMKTLSLDVSFKYRFAQPSFEYGFHPTNHFVAPGKMTLDPDYHLLSGQMGIAFHF
jgi:opacity protein-like surface antigen